MKNKIVSLILFLCHVASLAAQTAQRSTIYDENWGMNLWHLTKMMQDKKGFMWFSTWNGLARFDGYEFVTFKTFAGDGCPVTNDRIRDIEPAPAGGIYCLFDDRWFLFSPSTGRFSTLSAAEQASLKRAKDKNRKKKANKTTGDKKPQRRITDRQGICWTMTDQSITKTVSYRLPAKPLDLGGNLQARCFLVSKHGDTWISTKEDCRVRIYTAQGVFRGFLTPQGNVSSTPVAFPAAVYAMATTRSGDILLGTKPDGLYRLAPRGNGYAVSHTSFGSEKASSIYDIKEDASGRLWIATFDGIFTLTGNGKPQQVVASRGWRVRRLHLTQSGILLAATTNGLAIGKIPAGQARNMRLRLHQREPQRATSLSNSAVMDIAEDSRHHIFVATENGGINEIMPGDVLRPSVRFSHIDRSQGLDTDVAISLAMMNDRLLVTGGNALAIVNTRTGEVKNYGKGFFHQPHRYSEARPIRLANGNWLFGLQDGAFTLQPAALQRRGFVPPIVLTGIRIEQDEERHAVDHIDTLRLSPDERTIAISFAALDLTAPENINYAFRLHTSDAWTFCDKNHSITLPDLNPGTYTLQIKSTNAEGEWTANVRNLTLIVTHRFTETTLAHVLGILLLLGLVLGGLRIIVVFRHIKRKQRETLAAYLSLLENQEDRRQVTTETAGEADSDHSTQRMSSEDEQFMQRIMTFVEQHLGHSEVGVDEMAAATCTSRSGLNRRLKKLVGRTPAEFLREARLKHARRLLLDTADNVSDIAYECGFTDPKYFGKTFKTATGMSPSEWRQHGGKTPH